MTLQNIEKTKGAVLKSRLNTLKKFVPDLVREFEVQMQLSHQRKGKKRHV